MTKTIFLKIYISQLPDQVHQWYRDDSYDGTESNLKEMYCLFQKNWHLDDQTLETVIKGSKIFVAFILFVTLMK